MWGIRGCSIHAVDSLILVGKEEYLQINMLQFIIFQYFRTIATVEFQTNSLSIYLLYQPPAQALVHHTWPLYLTPQTESILFLKQQIGNLNHGPLFHPYPVPFPNPLACLMFPALNPSSGEVLSNDIAKNCQNVVKTSIAFGRQQIMRGIQINRGKQLKLTLSKSRPQPPLERPEPTQSKKAVQFHQTLNDSHLDQENADPDGNNRPKKTQHPSSPLSQTQKHVKLRTVYADSSKMVSASEVAASKTLGSRMSLTGSRTHSELKIKSSASICEQREFSKEVRTILQQLASHKLLSESYRGICTLRRQTLTQLLDYLFSALCTPKPSSLTAIHLDPTPLKCLHHLITTLCEKISHKRRTNYALHASLVSNCNPHAFNKPAYSLGLACETNKLGQMLQQQEDVKQILAKLSAEREISTREVDNNRKTILGQLRQKMQLQDSVKELGQLQRKLQAQLSSLQLQIVAIEQESNKIANYVDLQSNQILKMVSADYKRIEEDIYEYAVYLQANQLASSLDFEPLPFQAIEERVEEELKEVQLMLLREDVPVKERAEHMRKFMSRTMSHYRNKDVEVSKLGEFKTKCIRKFVSNMQKWLDNWSLKQEYLVNLRKEFAADCLTHAKVIRQAREAAYCDSCQKKAKQAIDDLQQIHLKIQENYKLGNSFY